MKRDGASVLNYLHRCWRHRSRHSPSTSSSEMKSDKGRIGRGPSSWRGGFISRKKSSKNLLKVFSSLAEPAIASHSWRDQRQLEPGKKSALLWIIGWSDSLVARVGEGPRRASETRGESHNRPTWRHKRRGMMEGEGGDSGKWTFSLTHLIPYLWWKCTFTSKGLICLSILHGMFHLPGLNSHVTLSVGPSESCQSAIKGSKWKRYTYMHFKILYAPNTLIIADTLIIFVAYFGTYNILKVYY